MWKDDSDQKNGLFYLQPPARKTLDTVYPLVAETDGKTPIEQEETLASPQAIHIQEDTGSSDPTLDAAPSIHHAETLEFLQAFNLPIDSDPQRSTQRPAAPDSTLIPYARNRRKRQHLLYECTICASHLPRSAFLNRHHLLLPHTCLSHLLLPRRLRANALPPPPGLPSPTPQPVCHTCLSTYLHTQFLTVGAPHIKCISPTCSPPSASLAWKYHALPFLPASARAAFSDELARDIWKADAWRCPDECGCRDDYVATPERTTGWPQVECPRCRGRFCARCRVRWHRGLGCEEAGRRARWEGPRRTSVPASPSPAKGASLDPSSSSSSASASRAAGSDEHRSLLAMQASAARLCPRCRTPIVKNGGCAHMACAKCALYFRWGDAERVVASSSFSFPFSSSDEGGSKLGRALRRSPLRRVGAWVWGRRAAWGVWRERRGRLRGAVVGWRGYVWWERGGCEGDEWVGGGGWDEDEDEEGGGDEDEEGGGDEDEEEEDDDEEGDGEGEEEEESGDEAEDEEGNNGDEDEVEGVGRDDWQRVWIPDDVRPVRRGWRTWIRR